MPRYKYERYTRNADDFYQELFDRRGLKLINHRRTIYFKGLDTDTIQASEYIWKTGDSLQKLSRTFYGSYDYWWVIGYINKKPTDAHYSLGDTIFIPVDPYTISDKIGG